jgi:hypothetical protein
LGIGVDATAGVELGVIVLSEASPLTWPLFFFFAMIWDIALQLEKLFSCNAIVESSP